MDKNKGFTIIELITSFSLVFVIVVILFQMIISLKEIYQTSGIKTELLSRQYVLVDNIYRDLYDKGLETVNQCGVNCLTLSFKDKSVKDLSVSDSLISYGNYTVKLLNSSSFGDYTFDSERFSGVSGNDSVLSINIPINDKLLGDDYGINIVYQYSSSDVAIGDISL